MKNLLIGKLALPVRFAVPLALILTMMVVFSAISPPTLLSETWKPGTIVSTTDGKIRGFEAKANTFAWKGIPFAKPPIGPLRWKAPRSPAHWGSIRETREFSERCLQFNRQIKLVGGEDCLYLNIWRPKTGTVKLPVYFWIHGGGNSIGTASYKRFDGIHIASKSNLVVVTINYRLGPLGWFTHPLLREGKNIEDDSGNYGTLDIIKALQWVKHNIAAFGGDPDNVTIAGVSAGAVNVQSLLISPLARGLFHRAIAESGGSRFKPISAGEAHVDTIIEELLLNDETVDDEDQVGDYVAKMSEDEIRTYLKSKSSREIFSAHSSTFPPMLTFPNIFTDGHVIHRYGAAALNDPKTYNQVPTILGSNRDETKLFSATRVTMMTPATYEKRTYASSEAWKIRAVDSIAEKLMSHTSQPPVYAYQFLYGMYREKGYNAWPTNRGGVNYALMFGASHGLGVSFFWGNYTFYGSGKLLFREDNRAGYEALTSDIMAYTAQFARTGNPNGQGRPEWKPWPGKDGEKERILFDADDQKSLIKMSNK